MKILRVYFKSFTKIGNYHEQSWIPDASGKCRDVEVRKVTDGIELVAADEVCLVPWNEIAKVYYKNEPAAAAPAGKSRSS